MREQTERAVDGRVATAEKAAADVLEEARALSGGLRQLGKSLEDHAERILRDVTAAHKRMRAELRVGGSAAGEPASEALAGAAPAPPAAPRSAPARKAFAEGRADGDGAHGGRPRRDPMDDLEVPSWVGDSR